MTPMRAVWLSVLVASLLGLPLLAVRALLLLLLLLLLLPLLTVRAVLHWSCSWQHHSRPKTAMPCGVQSSVAFVAIVSLSTVALTLSVRP